MRSLSLRWRFATSNALIVVLAMVVSGSIALFQLGHQSGRQLEESLGHKILLIEDILRDVATTSPDTLSSQLKRLDRQVGTRLTVIAGDGRVIADSRRLGSELDNHLQRPEIQRANQVGRGISRRYSTSVNHDMVYVAKQLGTEYGDWRYIRIAYPLTDLRQRRQDLLVSITIASLVGILVAIGMGVLSAGRITAPLQVITNAAQAYRDGDLSRRIPTSPSNSDAVGILATTFNGLAEELEQRLQIITGERNRLHAVLSSLSEGVIAVDREQRAVLLNQSAATMLDLTLPAPKVPLWELTRQQDILEIANQVLKDGQNRQRSFALFARRRPNQEIFIELHATTFNDEYGRAIGAVLIFHDISERRLLETMRRDFVANVSHELKTPLAAIRGLVETILDDPEMPAPTRQRFMGKVSDQCLRLSSIVMDLLTLSRAEARHDTDDRDAFDMGTIIRQSVSQLEQHAADRSVDITYHGPQDPLLVRGDPELLRQAVDNLVDNAIKYSSAGDQVTVTVQRHGDTLECAVSDNGLGIPKQHLDRIWERFYRVDKARSREVGGTGLGLSIVRNVITSHGGTVAVQSVSGEGSTFTFTIPLSPEFA